MGQMEKCIETTSAQAVFRRWMCRIEECRGEMKYTYTSTMLMSGPPYYVHQCTHCGRSGNAAKAHPYVDFMETK